MRLYITDEEKLTKFDLPLEIQESFIVPYRPANSKKEYTINVESGKENWILKSNGLVNLISNDINIVVNNAWSGSSSIAYRNSILRDKNIFISYGNVIKKYGATLRNQSELLENKIK